MKRWKASTSAGLRSCLGYNLIGFVGEVAGEFGAGGGRRKFVAQPGQGVEAVFRFTGVRHEGVVTDRENTSG